MGPAQAVRLPQLAPASTAGTATHQTESVPDRASWRVPTPEDPSVSPLTLSATHPLTCYLCSGTSNQHPAPSPNSKSDHFSFSPVQKSTAGVVIHLSRPFHCTLVHFENIFGRVRSSHLFHPTWCAASDSHRPFPLPSNLPFRQTPSPSDNAHPTQSTT